MRSGTSRRAVKSPWMPGCASLPQTARTNRTSLPTRELLVPGEDELLSHYRSTIGCQFTPQWYSGSAEPQLHRNK